MKITGFGDFLMHFSPIEKMRFHQAELMHLSFTGAEANVCMALGFWGEETEFVTRLPEHSLSKKGVSFLKSNGVGVQHIVYGTGRMGVYFLESGHSLRSSQVIYDRGGTLFANSSIQDYDWDHILFDTQIFYLSGITPSLSDNLLECCKEVLAECRKRNIPVFYDVNLRPALCDIEKSREIFAALCPYITYLIGNEEHLKQLLEIHISEQEDPSRLLDLTKRIQNDTKINNIAITVRRTPSANKAIIYASYYDGTEFAVSERTHIDVVDRVGSGDAFSAGVVYSFLHNFSAGKTVAFATASSAIKHTINSDINFATVQEIESLIDRKFCDVRR